MVNNHSDSEKRKPAAAHCLVYFFWLAATYPLYVSSHTQDSTYHSLCYTRWVISMSLIYIYINIVVIVVVFIFIYF